MHWLWAGSHRFPRKLRPLWSVSLRLRERFGILPSQGQEMTMKPYITATSIAFSLVATWAALVHLIA